MPIDGRDITPRVPRNARRVAVEPSDVDSDFVYYVTDNEVLTEQEVHDMKYRRQRDLNNVASKRCRENRKRKQVEMEEELEFQQRWNAELKSKLDSVTAKVQRLKEFMLTNRLIHLGEASDSAASLDSVWE